MRLILTPKDRIAHLIDCPILILRSGRWNSISTYFFWIVCPCRGMSEMRREEESTTQEVTFDSTATAIQYCHETWDGMENEWHLWSHLASDRLSHPDVDKRQLSKVVQALNSATLVNMFPAHEGIIAALNTNCPVSELVKHGKTWICPKIQKWRHLRL